MSSLENHKRESVKGNQGVSYLQLKTQAASFLPVLQGTRDATLFTIKIVPGRSGAYTGVRAAQQWPHAPTGPR
ncbi:unnamed protein product [Arabidopsis arenosa]|uniref:Uncharacterized protein n=1 Tax=Arabidopsis arenosa TaxID=38785 RepID=A0A8S2A8W2_ARAAE|nr:unnamed protein product [Arabidopsis arenosa]